MQLTWNQSAMPAGLMSAVTCLNCRGMRIPTHANTIHAHVIAQPDNESPGHRENASPSLEVSVLQNVVTLQLVQDPDRGS